MPKPTKCGGHTRSSKKRAPPLLDWLDSEAVVVQMGSAEAPTCPPLEAPAPKPFSRCVLEPLPDPLLAVEKLMLTVNLPPREVDERPRSGTLRRAPSRIIDCKPICVEASASIGGSEEVAPSVRRPSSRTSKVPTGAPMRPPSQPTAKVRGAKASAFRMDAMDSPAEHSKWDRNSGLTPSYAALGGKSGIQFHKMDADSDDEFYRRAPTYFSASRAFGPAFCRSTSVSALALDLSDDAARSSSCAPLSASASQRNRSAGACLGTKSSGRLPSLPSLAVAPGNTKSIAYTMRMSVGSSSRRGAVF